MGSADRTAVLALITALTTTVQCGDASVWTENRIINGCRFEPTVSRAVTMECDYEGISYYSTFFQSGRLSPSLQEIRILNARKIVIGENALSGLSHLRTVHLSKIGTLQIAKTNWTQISGTDKVTITIDGISVLMLDSDAFLGLRGPDTEIFISSVTSCSIAQNAFATESVIQSVYLKEIISLSVKNNAFRSEIAQLRFVDVTLADCGSGSLGGRIGSCSLSRVRVSTLHSGCFLAEAGWESLTIQSSRLGYIDSFGISGFIGRVEIRDSLIGRVHQRGLHLRVRTFTVHSTEVNELSPYALDVRFNSSASLQASSVTTLRENAFRGLEAQPGELATLSFQQVTADRSEDGSLAFAEHARLSLLDVILRNACRCDAGQQALQLVMGDREASHNASDEQHRAARRIMTQVRCAAGADTPTLKEFLCSECPAHDRTEAECRDVKIRFDWEDWKLPISTGVPLLLLVFAALVILVVRRRRRRSLNHSTSQTATAVPQDTKNAAPEPRYTKAPKRPGPQQHQDNQHGVTPDDCNHPDSRDHQGQHQGLGSEPLYCELSDLQNVHGKDLLPSLPAQPVYDDCGQPAQPVYDDCGPPAQPVYDDCGPPAQPVYDDCGYQGKTV